MQTASLASVVEGLLYIAVFYYVFKFLAKLFLPVVVKKVVQKAEESFNRQYGYRQTQQNQDEIIVDSAKSTKPHETKKVGEYVDYEEIE